MELRLKGRITGILLLTLLAICLVTSDDALADVIKLKSGKVVEGTIINQKEKFIQLDTDLGVNLTYYFDGIESINGRDIEQLSEEAAVNQNPSTPLDTAPVMPQKQDIEPANELIGDEKKDTISEMGYTLTYLNKADNYYNVEFGATVKEYANRIVVNNYSRPLEGSITDNAYLPHNESFELTKGQYHFIWDTLLENIDVWDLEDGPAVVGSPQYKVDLFFKNTEKFRKITIYDEATKKEKIKKIIGFMRIVSVVNIDTQENPTGMERDVLYKKNLQLMLAHQGFYPGNRQMNILKNMFVK